VQTPGPVSFDTANLGPTASSQIKVIQTNPGSLSSNLSQIKPLTPWTPISPLFLRLHAFKPIQTVFKPAAAPPFPHPALIIPITRSDKNPNRHSRAARD
jgi:hypothetical protein